MANVYDWFEERLEIQALAEDVTSKYVPPHVNIFYCLGGITLVCFLIQFATGFAMTFYYRPTVAEAFTSVEYIMNEVNFGWLIRSIHRWSASMMVLMMILHTFRVYLTGGFKKPRELTWDKWCHPGCNHRFFWSYWLLFALGPSWLLGCENR
jgi:cytochrome b6